MIPRESYYDPELARIEREIVAVDARRRELIRKLTERVESLGLKQSTIQVHMSFKRTRRRLAALGIRLRDARKQHGDTQLSLSRKMMVSINSVCNYEGGKVKPPKEEYIRIYPELEGAEEWKLLEE